MFTWTDTKSPAEVKDFPFDWTLELGSDTIASASAEFVPGQDADLTIDAADTFSGALSYVRLSGGTAGQQALIKGVVVTAGGQTLEEIGVLTVAETVDVATDALTDLQADLEKLKTARIQMLTKGGVKEVWRDGRRLVYNVASLKDLNDAIALYEGLIIDAGAAAGTVKKRHRALSVRFG